MNGKAVSKNPIVDPHFNVRINRILKTNCSENYREYIWEFDRDFWFLLHGCIWFLLHACIKHCDTEVNRIPKMRSS